MKHTPGPWRDCDAPSNFQRGKQFIRPVGSESLIAIVGGEMKQTERWANARLIAAAPELLALVEEMAQMAESDAALFKDDNLFKPFFIVHAEKLRAAIKKAKG